MQMVDRLSPVRTGVYNRTIAMSEFLRACDLVHNSKQVTEQGFVDICSCQFRERCKVLLWNRQDVHRRLGMDIAKGDYLVIFEDLIGRNCTTYYFAEKALHLVALSPCL